MLKLSAFSLRPAFRRAGAILLALAGVLPSAHPCFAQAGRSPLIIDYSPLLPAPGLTFDIIQDDEGTLYLAGTSFLTFDGDHWTSAVTLPDSFAIRRLRLGPDGRAWAAAMSDLGWFERGTDRQWRFHSLRAHLPEPGRLTEVWNVAPDATGATFVTENQVLRWDGTGFKTWEMPGTRRLFSCAADGVFLVNYQRDGLYTVDASGPQLLIPRALLGDAAVFWAEHHGAEWLLGTGDGFFRYDGRSLLPFGTEIAGILREHKITAAARLPDGRIAVGTMTAGIVFLTADGAVEYRLDTSNGLPTNSIDGVFSRTDGELWAATRTHILRIDDRPASALLDANVGLPRQAQRKFARLGGQLVVGNDNGVYLRDEATGKFSLVDALKGRPYHLQPTDDGLLVSGYRGVRRYVNGTVTPFYDTLVNVFFCQPSRTVRGDFLIGDNRRIVRRRSDGTVRELVPRLPDNPSSLAEDAAGNLWIGLLAHGFVAVRADGGPLAPESSGLPPLSGRTQVRGDAFGSVVVFSDAGAWIRTGNETRFMPVENYPRRPGAFISEFNSDGTCWVVFPHTATHAPSLGRVIVNAASAEWQPHSVDGLLQVGTPQGIFAERSAPGEVTLWIGGSERVLKHSLRQVSDPKPRPPVLRGFSRTAREEQRAPIVGAVTYAAQSIQFEVAAPEYRRRELLRLQTRLDGIDHEWVTLGRPSTRDLSALRAGDYRVRARVVAETGTTSDEVTLPLRVLPPWWRTAPAYGGVILAVGLALVGAYRLRVGTLRRRNRELEDKVRLRTRELEAANLAKTQFVANMSHDIRNPLNGIVGLTFALEDSPLDRRQRDIVATLRDCSTYLSTLVDDVLDFASIEAGRVELRPGPFSPAELVRSLGATMKPDATASGATLSFAVAADVPPQLFGDAGRIQQILVNFVSNAVKYAGGQIEVAILRPPHAPEEIEFAVTDSGPGLSAEEQATLFTKFARLDRSRRENIPGVGLGLASCRLLADLMGGGVGVESGPGRGSRFFLRLPLAVPVPAPEPAASNLPDARVLLVEDADYNAWAATAVLSRLGLSCDRARTGEEALQLFRAKRYNIVLLDRNLPDLHGTEVARRIRKLESESEGLPSLLLAVTAYCTARDRELCLEAGMDAFVGKPVTPDKLKRVLLAAGRKLLSAATIEAPREAAPAELDLSLLTYLSDGTEDGLAQQARRFLETLASTAADLDRAGRENDCAALAGRAHDVLGQAKMIGHTRLVAAASQLEYVARAGDPAACGGRLRVVIAEIESLNALIRRRPELAGLPSSHARAHNAQDQSAFADRVSGGR